MKIWLLALAGLLAGAQTHACAQAGPPGYPTITAAQVQPTGDMVQLYGTRFVYNTFLTMQQLARFVALQNGSIAAGTAGQIPFYAAAGNVLTPEGPYSVGSVMIGAGTSGLGSVGPFTADLPIFGAGTSGLKVGAKTGNTDTVAMTSGAFVPGNCRSTDSNSNEVDANVACGGGTKAFLHSADFGAATGNSGAANSTALQNWINACQTSGQTCWLDPGTYSLATALSVTNAVTIEASNFIDAVLAPAVGIDGIDINTPNPVFFYKFGINYPTTANTNTNGIVVTAPSGQENSSSVFRDIRILNPYTGINFQKASAFTLDNAKILLFAFSAIDIANGNNSDSGDSTITSGFYLGNAGSNDCAFWVSSGGLKFNHNKCVTTSNGFQIALAPGASTSQILVEDNSFDGMTGNGLVISRQGTTGQLTEVLFNGNTCSSTLICINIAADATTPGWLSTLEASGNTYFGVNSATAAFAQIAAGKGINIVNNNLQSANAATAAFSCTAPVVSVAYGIFVKVGTFAANTNSCSAVAISPN